MKLEAWEREPFWLKLITPFLKKRRFPSLSGQPETGKWYRIYAEGCVAANGDDTYADFQLGTENKLLIFFCGGGVSWNEYTAARPASLYQKDLSEGYYMIQVDLFTDLSLNKGIFEDSERNPFRNWSKLVVNYDTGDFHCGAGDFPYTAQDGSRRLCHHHGYTNYCGKFSVTDVFTQYGVPFTVLKPHVVHPLSSKFQENLRDFAAICRVVNGMKRFNLGCIGARTTAFKTVRFDEIALQKHGINVESFDLSEVFDKVDCSNLPPTVS